MGVLLIEPVTGGTVEAYDEAAAARLEARGFKRVPDKSKPKRAPRKRTVKKEQ